MVQKREMYDKSGPLELNLLLNFGKCKKQKTNRNSNELMKYAPIFAMWSGCPENIQRQWFHMRLYLLAKSKSLIHVCFEIVI